MNRIVINADLGTQKISRHIYGHFAEHLGRCIYEGMWVGEDSPIPNTRGWRNDLIAALKAINIPNLRWPGGCFADTYHWMDGIGPKEKRPSIVNIHWGGTTENNHVGTHEFLDLCEILGTEPYIAGNVGSGTVREMAEWLEYITMGGQSPMADLRRKNGREKPWKLKFWGVGNENWGCGGDMRPQYYADLYRQYANYCRHFTPGESLYKVACGLTDEWNEILMREAGTRMNGLSVHYYTVPGTWQEKGSATDFDADDWKLTLQKAADIEVFIKGTAAIMDRYDPEKKVGIVMDEWGTWYNVEPGTNPGFLYQQNTVRDALVAGVSLNIFNNHADRVQVANIAQTVNVLQAVALTDGASLLLTPTYHVFEMYKVHHDATLLPTTVLADEYVPARPLVGTAGQAGKVVPLTSLKTVNASASRDEAGKLHLTVCNLHHDTETELEVDVRGATVSSATGRILTGPAMQTMNTFESPDAVTPSIFTGVKLAGGRLVLTLPARSVVAVELV
ncbi:MAG: alpha-N-arabinofuranosidase [Tepidisphaeraceae bacterium]